ncbi:uncharacterized protein Z520_07534 [Fonsecaea multimorphosa CBS 102226]|uniref:Uncharacterized protein n=1 Tax=Fonsecaea multimorphosa CBS 102226 TaxID=1442371 RepID=A0A0D2K1B5_9EURO|nr:uncharacterized protein Z520_07534 [Fonsecaea multimorphosa CBS 102226]KIX96814.1 hypothetical protein Z520_07534 [Fonsecaea multimorphosa CBS 102226]OAL22494.1 hypothetical protein AYO22_07052 [Fonsecaea multimorphosa]
MASLALAIGAAIYFTTEKVRDHKKKKQALNAHGAPQYDSVSPTSSIMENNAARRTAEQLPAYVFTEPPPYHIKDQHYERKAAKERRRRASGGASVEAGGQI